MIVKHYSILEDELKSKPFEEGSIYVTTDTNRIYVDLEGKISHTLISADPIIISTESERANLLSPINDKIYFVLESDKTYIYNNGSWHSSGLAVDNELSESSTNAISNKAVYEAINALREELSEGATQTNVPVLNANYPMDTNFKYSLTGCVLSIIIDQYAAGCSYQWYKNNQLIIGANEPNYNFIPDSDTYNTYEIYCVVSNKMGSVISRTAKITCYPTKLYVYKSEKGFGYDYNKVNLSSGMSWQIIYYNGAIPYELRFYSKNSGIVSATLDGILPTSLYNKITITGSMDNNLYNDWNTSLYQLAVLDEASLCVFYPNNYSERKDMTITTDISSVNIDCHLKFQVSSNGSSYANAYYRDIYLE